jgi:hypothetical protein
MLDPAISQRRQETAKIRVLGETTGGQLCKRKANKRQICSTADNTKTCTAYKTTNNGGQLDSASAECKPSSSCCEGLRGCKGRAPCKSALVSEANVRGPRGTSGCRGKADLQGAEEHRDESSLQPQAGAGKQLTKQQKPTGG